jgi:HEAT repeat protein
VPASVAERVDRLVARVVAGHGVHEVERAAGAIAEYGARAAPSIERGLPAAPARARATLLDVLALVGAPGCGVRAAAWLEDGDWRVREAAARVCARHRTPAAQPVLITLLGDPVGRVRVAAAAACGALRDPAVTAALAVSALGPAGPERHAALAALVQTPGDAAVRVLTRVAALQPTDPAAVRALAQRAVPSVAESRGVLEAIVDTADDAVRRPALVGLARLGATGPESHLDTAKAVAREVAAALRPRAGPVMQGPDGVETLAALGAPAISLLQRRLAAADRPALVEACLRLQRLAGAASTTALRAAAARDDCPPFVIQELGRRRDREALPVLIRHAAGTSDLASPAVTALAEVGGDAAVAALAKLLQHERPRTRGDAAGALARAAGAAAAPLLEARLQPETEGDAFARWLALQALSLVDVARATDHARRLLRDDPAVRVREGAAAIVGRLGRDAGDGARLAQAAAGDPASDVRYTALQYARAAGADPAALLPALTDEVYLIRALALAETAPHVPPAQLRARATPRPEGAALDLARHEPDEGIRASAVTIAAARAWRDRAPGGMPGWDDPEEDVRIAAVNALTLHRVNQGAAAATRLQDESEAVRIAAMRVAAACGHPAGAAAAAAALGGGDHGLRLEAADALLAAGAPGAGAALRARLDAQPAPEREERLHLLRCLVELEDPEAAPYLAAELTTLGLRQEGLRRGRDTAARDRQEVRRFRLYCYRALAESRHPSAPALLEAAVAAAEQHVAVPALIARAGRALGAGDPRTAAGFARTALELHPGSAEAWVMVWRVAQRGALPAPALGSDGPHPNAVAAVLHRLGLDAAAVEVLRDPTAAARRDPKIARNLAILLDLLGRFAEANAAHTEAARLEGRAGGRPGSAERTAPGPDLLRRRARRALANDAAGAAAGFAHEALVRAAEPSGTDDEWLALVAQVTTAGGGAAGARGDAAWLAAARAALTTSRLRLDLADGRLFAIAAAIPRPRGWRRSPGDGRQ